MSILAGWAGPGKDAGAFRILSTEALGTGTATTEDAARRRSACRCGSIETTGRQALLAEDESWIVALLGRACRLESARGLLDDEALATQWLPEFRRDRTRALHMLRGGFTLAAIERASGRALLAVDRMGICPLAYAHTADGLLFGTSSEWVRRQPMVDDTLRGQALYDYIYFNMIPSPGTIYQGVSKLEPAEYLWWRPGDPERRIYWNPRFRDSGVEQTTANTLAEDLRQRLHSALEHCAPDADTGAFLSGGLDSSTVVGMAQDVAPGPVCSYSIGFEATGYDEIDYARIAARHFGAHPHEYYVTPRDVLEAVPRIAAAYDEPFGNSSVVPTYFCARLAREDGMRTLLAGDGGDELFAGNERYATQQLFESYFRLPAPLRHYLIEPAIRCAPGRTRLPLLSKARRYVEDANIPLPRRMERYNFLQRLLPQTVFEPEFLEQIDTAAPVSLLERVYSRARSGSALNRMLYLDWKQTLADNDLRKVNGMCELAGVHVMYPMLDDDLVELSTRIPVNLKLKGRDLRHFYKKALAGILPTEIINKKKHGFGLPFGVWLCETAGLQELACDSLDGLRQRRIIKPKFLDWLMDQHRNVHPAYYGEIVWVLMMLELWLSGHGYSSRPVS